MRCFVTGTDTDVGKTFFSELLVRAWNQAGQPCAGFKPIASGDRGDAIALHRAGPSRLLLDQINPVWLKKPLAPLVAARAEGSEPDLARIESAYRYLCGEVPNIVAEGAGGWFVPIATGTLVADLAVRWNLPVIIVAANRLGVVNHTLLTIEAVRNRGLPVLAVVLNQPKPAGDLASATNLPLLRELLPDIPILELGYGAGTLPPEVFECVK